jgi:hypothetical protein
MRHGAGAGKGHAHGSSAHASHGQAASDHEGRAHLKQPAWLLAAATALAGSLQQAMQTEDATNARAAAGKAHAAMRLTQVVVLHDEANHDRITVVEVPASAAAAVSDHSSTARQRQSATTSARGGGGGGGMSSRSSVLHIDTEGGAVTAELELSNGGGLLDVTPAAHKLAPLMLAPLPELRRLRLRQQMTSPRRSAGKRRQSVQVPVLTLQKDPDGLRA